MRFTVFKETDFAAAHFLREYHGKCESLHGHNYRVRVYVGAEELDSVNQRINATVNAEGRFFISSTRLHGAFSLRICILGFRITEADVRELVSRVIELARSAGHD